MREKTIEQKLVQAVKAKGGIAPKFVSPGFSGVPTALSYCRMGNAASWKSRPLAGNHGRCRSQGYGFCGGWASWYSSWTMRARSRTFFLRSEVMPNEVHTT